MEYFTDQITGILLDALLSLTGIVLVFIYSQTRKYLAARTTHQEFAFIGSVAERIVRYLEQSIVYADETGETKKKVATATILSLLENHGIKVQRWQIDHVIEAAVQVMKQLPLLPLVPTAE